MKKLNLFLFMVFCASTYFAQIPTQNLVGFYPFNGNTIDSSTMNNDATANGCTYVSDRFGIPNSAIKLNGEEDSIRFPIQEFSPILGDFSMSFWIKTSSPEIMNLFSSKQFPNDTTNNFEFQLSSNNKYTLIENVQLISGVYTYWNGVGDELSSLKLGPANKYNNGYWHHFVLKRNLNTLELWHNRVLWQSQIYSGTLGDAVDLIFSSAPYRYKGLLDDMAFYNRGISENEIIQLYHDRNPFEFVSPKKTDAYVQGDTLVVDWRYNAEVVGDSVNLEFRINGTGDWTLTTHNQLVDWFQHEFPMNYPYGTKVQFKISDRHNPNFVAYSGECIVSEYKWQQVTPTLPFTPRDGVGLLHFQGKFWALGGWDPPFHPPNHTHNEVWNSVDGLNWVFVNNAPWPARHVSGWLIHDNAMWLVGGDPQSGSLTDVWTSSDGVNWTEVLNAIPNYQLRSLHHVASSNGNIFSFGGSSTSPDDICLNEVWKSADGTNWSQLPNAPWIPRGSMLNSVVDNDQNIWLLGGGRVLSFRDYNDVWKTADGINWTEVSTNAPWDPRHWHNTAWYDNKMWVLNGSAKGEDNGETWYSADGVEWFELKNSKYTPRHAASAVVADNTLWSMFGAATNNVWKLQNQATLGLHEITKNEGFVVYPNPANNEITISNLNQELNYSIKNIEDKIIQSGKTSGKITISSLKSGVYFLNIEGKTSKIIIE